MKKTFTAEELQELRRTVSAVKTEIDRLLQKEGPVGKAVLKKLDEMVDVVTDEAEHREATS
jgi:hypothetical protein